ncbi:hypothetical protein AVEN_85800-1 [Araneus ventricosus]|uniref:Uncharacterized protein n=1 Tax=Araneus ventricosus TaxID=182803 RepID=A0A4Y2EIQ4_ARAVE|nr:hypothetical protein AVEN_85800-1 [Araneus ventricosus]
MNTTDYGHLSFTLLSASSFIASVGLNLIKTNKYIRHFLANHGRFVSYLYPQIAILVCSRLALQVCKLSANLSRQVCKCETSLQQVNASLDVTIGRTCSKLALQTIAKTEYGHNPG